MARNIVVCCDGTGDTLDTERTNVGRIYASLADDADQTVFYDAGVGTFGARFFGVNVGKALGKGLGLAFGYGIKQNMENCYRFLVANYAADDRVYLIGFSRGAFTARSLASMLVRCGVLEKQHESRVSDALKLYLKGRPTADVNAFKNAYARDCIPRFVGVWETVGALGVVLATHRFTNNTLNPQVPRAYQALSIDEKRKKFAPTLWDESHKTAQQIIQQVWFPGVHSDVGGGYSNHELADIPLRWMMDHAASDGVRFKPERREAVQGDPLGRMHHSYKGWWRLLGKQVRHIPKAAQISDAARTRQAQDPDYNPANLPPAQGS